MGIRKAEHHNERQLAQSPNVMTDCGLRLTSSWEWLKLARAMMKYLVAEDGSGEAGRDQIIEELFMC